MWFLIAACLAVASGQRTDPGQQTIPAEYFGLLQQLIPNAPERGIIFTRTSEADANSASGTVGNGHAIHEARLRAALSGRNPNIALIQPYQQPIILQDVPLQRTQTQPGQIDNSQKLSPAQPQVFLQTPQRQEVLQPQQVQGQRQQAVSVKQTQNTEYQDQQLQQKTVADIYPHPFILQTQQAYDQRIQEERQQPPSQSSLSQTVQVESPQQEEIVYQQPHQNLKASRRLRPSQQQPQIQTVDAQSPQPEEIVYQQIQNEQVLRRQRPTQQTLLQPIDATVPQQQEVVTQQVLQEQPVRRLRPTQQSTLRTVEVQSPQELEVVYQPTIQESGLRRQRPTQRPPLRNVEIQSPQDQEIVYQPVQQEQPARRHRPTQQSQLRTVQVESAPEQEVVYQQVVQEPEIRRQRPTQQSVLRTIEIQSPQEQEVVYQQPLQDQAVARQRPTQQTVIQVQSPQEESVYQQVYQRNQRTRPIPQPTLEAAVEQSPQQQEVVYQVDRPEPQLPRRRKPTGGSLRTSQHQALIQPVESEGQEQEQVIYQQVQQDQPIQRQRQSSVLHRQRPQPEQQQDVQIQTQEIPQIHNIEQEYQPRQNFGEEGIPPEASRAVPPEQYLRETTRPTSSRRRQKKPNTSLFTRQRQEPQTDIVDKEVVSSLLGESEDNYGIFPTPSSKSTIFVSESAGGKVSVSEENSETEKPLPVVRLPTPKGQRPLTQAEFQALVEAGFQVTPVTDGNAQASGRANNVILVPDGEAQAGSEEVRHRQRTQIDPSRRRLRSRRPKSE